MLHLHLRDTNPQVVAAWELQFGTEPDVTISLGDILELEADAIVSPANSFGFMDGGIDLAYAAHFGHDLESRLQHLLRDQHFGELPVGQAVTIETRHPRVPILVSAPTMRVPSSICRTVNVYLACRAALVAMQIHNRVANRPIESLLMPGLGTGVGEVPPLRAARQMRLAYDSIIKGHGMRERNAGQIWGEHHELLN